MVWPTGSVLSALLRQLSCGSSPCKILSSKVTAAGQVMPGSQLGHLGRDRGTGAAENSPQQDPDLPARTAAGGAGETTGSWPGWGLGWDPLPARLPPAYSRWGPVCLSRALSLRRAAERLLLPPSLLSVGTPSPWFTQHRGCVLGVRTAGPCRGGAGGHEDSGGQQAHHR